METESAKKLTEYGLESKVVSKLEEIFTTGKLTFDDLDERALDALKEFSPDGAISVLKQFLESNLEHVSNKSAYLCGVMKTYRQKQKQGVTVQNGKGPDQEKIQSILDRTGYSLDVTVGQRKYGGPPPNWEGSVPGTGCEVFAGKIPKEIFEDELIPLFEKCGTIWDLRLMMDPMTGLNRGYCFVTFVDRSSAKEAVTQLDNYEIKKGKKLKVNISVPNQRLFVGNIPKSKGKGEILEEFTKYTAGLEDVIIYSSPDDKKRNRGFCFLEYDSHKSASLAKRKLSTGRIRVWNCDIIVDWADPQEEPDDDTMSKVKVLYVRNLTQDATEDTLKTEFEEYGKVERIKKIKDYAFVHFEERDAAVKAMDATNGKEIAGAAIEVSLAKPPSDKKKKDEMMRKREMRVVQMMSQRGGGGMMPPGPMRGGGRGVARGAMGRGGGGDYDYGFGGYSDPYLDDYYGYDDYYPPPVPPPPPPRGRSRAQPNAVTVRGGRGIGTRGRVVPMIRGSRGMGSGMAMRGTRGLHSAPHGGRGQSLAGKRKFEGGHQNQGDPKRRMLNAGGWGPAMRMPGPHRHQPMNGEQFYQDTYGQQWS